MEVSDKGTTFEHAELEVQVSGFSSGNRRDDLEISLVYIRCNCSIGLRLRDRNRDCLCNEDLDGVGAIPDVLLCMKLKSVGFSVMLEIVGHLTILLLSWVLPIALL